MCIRDSINAEYGDRSKRNMVSAPDTTVQSLPNTKGMSDAMQDSVRKAAVTICHLREEGRDEEADALAKMVAESCGQLASNNEHSEVKSRMEELGTTTKMIGEHLTTGILKEGQVQIEELKESVGFLAKCKPMLETQLELIQGKFSALPAEEQIKYVTILEKAVDMSKLLGQLITLAEQ
eukprot:TRINITY_DN13877_c0_g1_i6.p1 TRINITY_DN13877_c0_g1~~TRINITY_DN13877_c0_g1_i6.p1  ORF type:complete len:179 (-),score=88.18 TRINITY_DN13877_c0_g1_i6:95-631(-)